jgi:hypothetical protein
MQHATDDWDSARFWAVFWLQVGSVKETLSRRTHRRVRQVVCVCSKSWKSTMYFAQFVTAWYTTNWDKYRSNNKGLSKKSNFHFLDSPKWEKTPENGFSFKGKSQK